MSCPLVGVSPRFFLPRHAVLTVHVGALGQLVPRYFGLVEAGCITPLRDFPRQVLSPLRKTGGIGARGVWLLTSLFLSLICVCPCLPLFCPCFPCVHWLYSRLLGGKGGTVQMQHGPPLPLQHAPRGVLIFLLAQQTPGVLESPAQLVPADAHTLALGSPHLLRRREGRDGVEVEVVFVEPADSIPQGTVTDGQVFSGPELLPPPAPRVVVRHGLLALRVAHMGTLRTNGRGEQ